MEYVTCINESVYPEALTYAQHYRVFADDPNPHHPKVKIQADNGRVRWFPATYFVSGQRELPRLHEITVRDAPVEPLTIAIEVDLTLSNRERRWCLFTTPTALNHFGDMLLGTTIRIHYSMAHLIVVSAISEDIIIHTLHHLERQGQLFMCTKSIQSEA